MSNQYFSICGLLCIILLMVVFFCKKKINSIETKIYGIMLICSCIDVLLVILEVSFGYMNLASIPYDLLKLLNKIDMIYYVLWPTLLFLYMYYITYKNEQKYIQFRNFCFILDAIFIVIEFLLPINIINNNGEMGVDGIATNFVLLIATIYFIAILVVILRNFKSIKLKKCIPYITLIIFMVLAIYLRNLSPTLIVIPAIMVYIDMIMYFTIENPDLKLLNEFYRVRKKEENNNDAKNEFLANISKDIKTPIANIKAISSEALNSNDPEILKNEIRKIQNLTSTLSQLVSNILDISDIEKQKLGIKMNKYQVYNMFNVISKVFEKTIGSNIEYRFNYDKSIPDFLYGDSIRIKQIVNIILENSREYTEKGFIELSVNSIIKNDICRLIITIEDSGIGISSDKLDHLFDKEKIYSDKTLKIIDDNKNNLGIAKSIIDLMNGSITVNSELGIGTKITIAIDQIINKENKTNIEETVDQYEKMLLKKKKVLLVISSPELSKKINSYLKKSSYDIIEVIGGQPCLEKLRNKEKYNIILIEENLQKLSSEDTLIKIKDTPGYKIPVVLISNNKGFGMKEMYQEKGYKDVIFMPIKKNELLEIIKNNLD